MDLGRQEAFVISVVPFSHIFVDNMMRKLREMIKQEMERLVSSGPRGDNDGADVLRINDS